MSDSKENFQLRNEEPPTSNTGVPGCFDIYTIPCLDWVQVTFKSVQNSQENARKIINKISSFFGIDDFLFEHFDEGLHGYRKSYKFLGQNTFQLLFDAPSNMGIHLILTGSMLKLLRSDYGTSDIGLLKFLSSISKEFHFSRVDVAKDDTSGSVSIKKIARYIKDGNLTTRFRGGHQIKKFKLIGEEEEDKLQYVPDGETWYLGSRSGTQFRFYDKKAQMNADDLLHWTRCELQLVDDAATNFVKNVIVLDKPKFEKFCYSVFLTYVDFKKTTGAKHMKNRDSAKFWADFLDSTVEKVKLGSRKKKKSLDDVNPNVLWEKLLDGDADFYFESMSQKEKDKFDKWFYEQISSVLYLRALKHEEGIEEFYKKLIHWGETRVDQKKVEAVGVQLLMSERLKRIKEKESPID
ncbi:TPA: replication initiation factor domain-containing protein [Bacillus thuringiensis]|nr:MULTISPECIES: replication initiation factor domain-containing protein [Bacillus cereus group]ETE91562.1 replication initiation protein [Bacillus thuringiensis serovar aizawai str. Hu4-2]MCU5764355.1 replication initiation factor domain-containing protein [Bacillus cereus]MCC3901377.1 replication initiation factor domain-containing protein [Bacillus thuringiensis]MCC3964398.1 replication initiation factor domain-containing protein [Bacillus thuringiensis]MCC3989100.1 replication initiation f